MFDQTIQQYKAKMAQTTESLTREFAGLRTGRASANLLDPVKVDAYGSLMPLSQVGTVSVPEPRMIVVQVWDSGLVIPVEKAIREAGLGLNPSSDRGLVRVPIPDLNEERRKELVKVASKYAEQARISIRNIRREGLEMIKKAEKDKQCSQDDSRRYSGDMQKITDDHIQKIDQALQQKEKDIMTV